MRIFESIIRKQISGQISTLNGSLPSDYSYEKEQLFFSFRSLSKIEQNKNTLEHGS